MVQHREDTPGQMERQDAQGQPLPEGTKVVLSLALAPEYYRDDQGAYRWEDLSQGAYITQEVTIDNTAPVASDISLNLLDSRELKVTASDNQYVAAIALLSPSGSRIYRATAANQSEPGTAVETRLSLEGVPSQFLVAVYDYAMNVSTYRVDLGGPAGGPTGPISQPSTGQPWTMPTVLVGWALTQTRIRKRRIWASWTASLPERRNM